MVDAQAVGAAVVGTAVGEAMEQESEWWACTSESPVKALRIRTARC